MGLVGSLQQILDGHGFPVHNLGLRTLILLNPQARATRGLDRVALAAPWRSLGTVDVVETATARAARDSALEASTSVDVIVAVGGDGTANTIAGVLPGCSAALAVLPAGTTNVFARAIGTSRDPLVASAQLAQAVAEGRVELIRPGRANDRLFLANAGVGLDAAIVARVESGPRRKRYFGQGWFAAAALREVLSLRHQEPLRLLVRRDGISEQAAVLVVALRTGPYTFLGSRALTLMKGTGLRAALDVAWVPPLGIPRTLAIGLGMLAKRGPQRRVNHSLGVSQVSVSAACPFGYQVDGEFVGVTNHVELALADSPLRVVLPKKT